jgi:MGT family glycosyltransferase
MSKVLFLNIPAHGHVNPTLGLVDELVRQGEEVTYFCSEEFREKIEKTGAIFKSYGEKSNLFKSKHSMSQDINIDGLLNRINEILISSEEIIQYILEQINGIKFDYIAYGSMFYYGNIISQILKVPAISSFAVFATQKDFISKGFPSLSEELPKNHAVMDNYKKTSTSLNQKYNVKMPKMKDLFFNKGDLNIAYTSKFFISHIEYYDNSFIFIGPPIYDRKETIDFPFEKLKDQKVVYISLGTVFNNTDSKLYDIFFRTFADYNAIVVMSAYNIDVSKFHIPKNFIVKNYVPQSEILKYTDVAITHAGMNSTSDLLYNNVPFVAIPIGADQPYMAARVSELGAAISVDKDNLTTEILRTSVEKVLTDPSYLENIKKISASFKEAGGYKKAVEEILKFKKEKEIFN